MRSHSAPSTEPSRVMPPYQIADASAIGTKVRTGAESHQARERRHHRADARQKAAEEDAGHAEAEILALDDGERPGARSRRPGRRGEEPAAVAPGHEVDAGGAEQVGDPGDEEDGERAW